MLQPYQNMDYEIIKRLLKCRSKGLYVTYPYMNTPAVASAMNRMFSSDYFRYWTTEEQAESLTVSELKALLQESGQSQQGNKNDLVKRVLASVPADRILSAAGIKQIRLSHAGEEYFNFLKDERQREYDELIDNIRVSCLRGDFNTPYHNMCLYETRQYFKRGLGIDWEQRAKHPIPHCEQIAAYQFMKQNENKEIAAMTVAYNWLGNPSKLRDYMIRYPEHAVNQEIMQYGNSVLSSLSHLETYKVEDKRAEYQVVVNDGACEHCKIHQGKIYRVSDAQIGVNCPPFHLECRCCITAVARYADGTAVQPVVRGRKKNML